MDVMDKTDVENDMEAHSKPFQLDIDTHEVLETAALLAIWSLLVINEGSIRFIRLMPSGDLSMGRPQNGWLFAASLCEVFFGLIGLSIGVSSLVLRWYSTIATKVAIAVQMVLGWFVFIVYVFTVPAFQAADLKGLGNVPILSLSSERLLITMGILTSLHFCLALQGGQFLFMGRLVAAATGTDFLKQKTGNQMRAMFWNMNLAGSGLWTIITGAVINSKIGGGQLKLQYVYPPNVGTLPGLTICTGLVFLVWGCLGAGLGVMKMAPTLYFVFTGLVYLLGMLNFGIAQFGTFAGVGGDGPVAMHNGLVFMVVFLGPYFVYKSFKEHMKENQD